MGGNVSLLPFPSGSASVRLMFGDGSGPWPLVATCSRGLEGVLASELAELGLDEPRPGRGVVEFRGDLGGITAANLWLRTAMRVLVPLASGSVSGRDALYDLSTTVRWENLIRKGQTLAVEVAGRCRAFRDTSFAGRVVKDAVVDRLRQRRGGRPDVDRDNPDLRIHVHLSDGASTISLDSSGEPLSHRGYRPRGGPAPLAESLAAGVVLLTGYDGSQPLLDPMCGTGTLAIEAAMIATATAPGLHRPFAFERWPVVEPALVDQARTDAHHARRQAPTAILAWDHDGRAVQATSANLRSAGVSRWVEVAKRDLDHLETPFEGGIVLANPPYGKRLGDETRLLGLYRRLGDRLKHHATGNTAWLLVGSRQLANAIGLKASRRIPLFNGPIECRLLRYDLYEGSGDQGD